jgi:T5SS/PEP-CTERM-associated repeat protein
MKDSICKPEGSAMRRTQIRSISVWLVLGMAVSVAVSYTRVSSAVTRNWSAGDGNWSTAANWSPASVPESGDAVSIGFSDGLARSVAYDYAGPAVTLTSLGLDLTGSVSNASTLTISDHNLRATNEYVGYSGRGAVQQSGGTNTVDTSVYLGYNASALGTYHLSGPGVLAVAGDQFVAYSGSGTFNITSGGLLSNANCNIGMNVGSSGFVSVDGAGSQWTNNGVLAVGLFGQGELGISAGGRVASVNGRIGREAGASGTVLVDGLDSTWQMTGDLTVGSIGPGGTGSLTIQNQALVHAGNLLAINSLSIVMLNGGTLRFNTATGLNRLVYTSGTIQLAGDRSLKTDSTITTLFGATPNITSGNGLTIEGTASIGVGGVSPVENILVTGGRLKASSLRIGGDGNGVVQITSGGILELPTGSGTLLAGGNDLSKTGSIVVSGAGSTINSEVHLGVGWIVGGGSMTIASGAAVNCFAGGGISGPIGTASVTVTGAGSTWSLVNSDLAIGGSSFGYGTLNVQDGGSVFVGGELKIHSASGSAVNINGGTLRFDAISGTAGLSGIHYTSGTIQLGGDRTIGTDAAVQSLYGTSPLLLVGKGLTVEGTATLSSDLTINGGTFTAGAIDGAGGLNFASGNLAITGPAGVSVGGTSPLGTNVNLGRGSYLNVMSTLQIAADGRLSNVGGNVVAGSVQIDAGGRWTVIDGVQSVGAGLVNHGKLVLVETTIDGPVTSSADSMVNVIDAVTFNSSFSGAGQFFGSGTATFTGGYTPGDSPAIVSFEGGVAFGGDNVLTIELGGTTPGMQYDRLQVAGGLALDGTLQITLIDGFAPAAGNSFDILNWSALSGTFSSVSLPTLGGAKTWNTSLLYTSGVISIAIAAHPGDFDSDGDVDGADFVIWQTNFPATTGHVLATGDADGDGDVDGADFVVWQTNFPFTPGSGASPVPEPATWMLALVAVGRVSICQRRRI